MQTAEYIPRNPEREDWDIIVVGAGMGGGTTGYELARRGRRVLFIEKGKLLHAGPVSHDPEAEEAEIRLRAGYWPKRLQGRTTFGDVRFFAPLGCGTGGSTTLYGAQLERFRPEDFHPRANHPRETDANLPESWPIAYDQFVPYYRRAEAHYRVRGTPDPLNPDPDATLLDPPPLSERDQILQESLRAVGLHPYRSHVGFYEVPECAECLDLCPRSCKNDAGRRSLMPALQDHGASLLPECEVLEILADRSRVSGVRARHDGREVRINARAVVLGAGTLMTPVLLLGSRSDAWPNGVANRTGLVGRNLMLHTSDFLTIDHRTMYPGARPLKSLALNDFYFHRGKKLGTIQAVGIPIVSGAILSYLRYAEARDPQWWRRPVTHLLPLAARAGAWVFRRASLFSTIVEDLPYADNRVLADPRAANGRRFEYRYTRDLYERNNLLRRQFTSTLASRHRVTVVTGGKNNLNYGHACGTCRFGDDPDTSVLDPTNRAHDLDNLYVVDASFLPSSGGINPSLTIAANAFRVAEAIDAQLG